MSCFFLEQKDDLVKIIHDIVTTDLLESWHSLKDEINKHSLPTFIT